MTYYTVTNVFRGEPDDENGSWNTEQKLPETGQPRFPNGYYQFGVYAIDEFGNRLDLTTTVEVRN